MSRFEESEFGATHNSYSGALRGSIEAQLSGGIRCVELDFHDNGYEDYRDYRLGHGWPGDQVALGGGNPLSPLLRDWLGVVAQWSSDHPGHAPVTVVLDVKDDLTDNEAGGDLEDLNQTLESVFGPRLFTPEQLGTGPWPDVSALRDRTLFVLSGRVGTRVYYRWTRGTGPSIAVNDGGDVVLAYQSTSGDLRCWTGRIALAATGIAWSRRGTYSWNSAPLSDAAIAINDDRWVVAVHTVDASPGFPAPVAESRVGRLQADGRVTWFSSERYAVGRAPTIRIDGDAVRSVLLTADGRGRRICHGRLDRQRRKIRWGKAKSTTTAPFPRDVAAWQSHDLRCAVGSLGEVTASVDPEPPVPVRFRQIAFLERQDGETSEFLQDAPFFAAPAGRHAAIQNARLAGRVVRAWGFEVGDTTNPHANMPATDRPSDPRYLAYLVDSGAVA